MNLRIPRDVEAQKAERITTLKSSTFSMGSGIPEFDMHIK